MSEPVEIYFENGTLRFANLAECDVPEDLGEKLKFDPRSKGLRARACDYGDIFLSLRMHQIPMLDHARDFAPLPLQAVRDVVLRPHQLDALRAWRHNSCRGVAALPTGAGKTVLACGAINQLQRPALILVPTIDLLLQWVRVLEDFFGCEVGMLGGGEHRVLPLTVCTYDSAVLQMEFVGNKFALLVADECHHLPGPMYSLAAAMSIAPYRLGLSATPELDDERNRVMTDLLGPVVCQVDIGELEGKYLSPYQVCRVSVPLEPDEEKQYQSCRELYTAFLRANRIDFRNNSDWGRFLGLCARSAEGKKVLQAFFTQRRIARSGRGKTGAVWEILQRHAGEKTIIFTADNASAYLLGREFFLPVITHHTAPRERKEMLDGFRGGAYPVLVTSKVLNEGVDVPGAEVGIVLSGSASVREHVQRLGRILRCAPGKEQATLYELVSSGTSEESVSERRRDHNAYRGR